MIRGRGIRRGGNGGRVRLLLLRGFPLLPDGGDRGGVLHHRAAYGTDLVPRAAVFRFRRSAVTGDQGRRPFQVHMVVKGEGGQRGEQKKQNKQKQTFFHEQTPGPVRREAVFLLFSRRHYTARPGKLQPHFVRAILSEYGIETTEGGKGTC